MHGMKKGRCIWSLGWWKDGGRECKSWERMPLRMVRAEHRDVTPRSDDHSSSPVLCSGKMNVIAEAQQSAGVQGSGIVRWPLCRDPGLWTAEYGNLCTMRAFVSMDSCRPGWPPESSLGGRSEELGLTGALDSLGFVQKTERGKEVLQ